MMMQSFSTLFDALGQKDLDTVASFFAPDARVLTENMSVHHGKDAITAALERRFNADHEIKIRLTSDPDFRQVTDDVGIIECKFRTEGGSKAAPNEGLSVSVIRKEADRWSIVSHWMIKAA